MIARLDDQAEGDADRDRDQRAARGADGKCNQEWDQYGKRLNIPPILVGGERVVKNAMQEPGNSSCPVTCRTRRPSRIEIRIKRYVGHRIEALGEYAALINCVDVSWVGDSTAIRLRHCGKREKRQPGLEGDRSSH